MRKEDLIKYSKIKDELEQIKEKLDEIEATYTQVKAVCIDGMPKGNSVRDSLGDAIAKIESIREIYNYKISQLIEIQIKIENVIDKLDGDERILMRKRYIDGLKWEDVCREINYSWKTTHRMHNRILEKIKDDIEWHFNMCYYDIVKIWKNLTMNFYVEIF